MKTLRDVEIGATAKVKKLHGEGAVKRRIMDMGLTKGVEVYVRKVAPLGDPIEVTVRGYELSLRKADAEMVEVEAEEAEAAEAQAAETVKAESMEVE
ncbi:MAG: ferrous iron transport protein A [Firmicutes bacterium]|nr:ferrous iron transport protein A [Bacillota bacterium]MBR0179193.1 ferrous iron transport protein A [Bacillota bacterium]